MLGIKGDKGGKMVKKYNKAIFFLFGAFCLLIPSFAYANAGVPMIFLTFPAMLTALIPICLVEAGIYRNSLNITYKKAIMPSFVSNLTSTVIGIPLSWGLLLGIELATAGGSAHGTSTVLGKITAVTLQAAWLIPYEEELYWMVPVAAMIGLIPAYFVSVLIEYNIVKLFFKSVERPKVKRTVWKANKVTYIILFALLYVYLFVSIVHYVSIPRIYDEKLIFSDQQIVEVAKFKAKELGYNLEEMNVHYDVGNQKIREHLKRTGVSVYDKETKQWKPELATTPEKEYPQLHGRHYQAVYFGPKKMQLGGDLWVFVDRNTGKVITYVRGK